MASRICICTTTGLLGTNLSQQLFVMLIGEFPPLSFPFSTVVISFSEFALHRNRTGSSFSFFDFWVCELLSHCLIL